MVAITHDRYFWTTRRSGFWNSTGATAFLTRATTPTGLSKEARLAQEQRSEDARQGHEERAGVGATKPQRATGQSKARLARFEEPGYDYQKRNETQEIFIPVAERLAQEVIRFESVSKSFGERLLMDKLSFSVPLERLWADWP